MEVKKVRIQGEQKIITIPKHCEIEVGDYVIVRKLKTRGEVKKNIQE